MFKIRSSVPRSLRACPIARQNGPSQRFHVYTNMSARKDSQDRESMNVDPTEYSKTGGDASVSSSAEDAAFSRDKTRPEEQLKSAEKESGSKSNPLDGSPANQEISQPVEKERSEGSKAESSGESSGRQRTSGGGSAPKSG